jgi:hypothetical protein
MSYQVFRAQRGSVLHIIHQTLTGYNHVNGVYVLCNVNPYSGERERGTPTCPKCLQLDNPFAFSNTERTAIARIATAQALGWDGPAIKSFHKKDLIDKSGKLTRRGDILVQDWLRGAAPAAAAGVVHARDPLASYPRCNWSITLDGFDKMTVDRYERLRALDLRVTCVVCATLSFR